MLELSVLDLCPVGEDFDVKQAYQNSVAIAQLAEKEGYHRIWYAEHHNMLGIASSATSVLIDYIASNTKHIRVGSGGIMLPNHSPLTIAEQFGTLVQLHGKRIDLGVGRAPGTDQKTMKALRRNQSNEDTFSVDVQMLLKYFQEFQYDEVNAVPAINTEVPVWILGSSHYGAQLAASLGLPYSYASHFSAELLDSALEIYRSLFKPSTFLQKPYVILPINVVLADNQAEAEYQFTSFLQSHLKLMRGKPGKVSKPVRNMDELWDEYEKISIISRMKYSFIGTPESIEREINQFIKRYHPNGLMVTTNIYDQKTRENTLKLFKTLRLVDVND